MGGVPVLIHDGLGLLRCGLAAHLPAEFESSDASRSDFSIRIPISIALTAILPLAIGPFLSFLFRVWHYLAYTALVAVELAYYLRWQE